MISKKILEKIEEWRILKLLIDLNKNMIFILNNKSKNLIENIFIRIIIQIKIKIEKKNMNKNNNWNWDYKRNI